MNMFISIKHAQRVAEDIWMAAVEPSDIRRRLGDCENNYGDSSVVLLTELVSFDDGGELEFDPAHAHVLNVGVTTETLFLRSKSDALVRPEKDVPSGERPQMSGAGDTQFVDRLPPDLQLLGEKLLSEVRRHFPGELRYYPRSGKFVESPDNFWTVRIQPRDRSLRITVRGVPTSFLVSDGIVLKPDMRSYSAFKISSMKQISGAISIIRQARRA